MLCIPSSSFVLCVPLFPTRTSKPPPPHLQICGARGWFRPEIRHSKKPQNKRLLRNLCGRNWTGKGSIGRRRGAKRAKYKLVSGRGRGGGGMGKRDRQGSALARLTYWERVQQTTDSPADIYQTQPRLTYWCKIQTCLTADKWTKQYFYAILTYAKST